VPYGGSSAAIDLSHGGGTVEESKAVAEHSPLARNVIGLREVFFQAVTHTGPAISAAFAIALGAAYFGGSLPLAVVLAMVGILFCAISFGELSRHVPSAGGLYAYIARSLHPRIGFLIAWAYALAEPLVVPSVLGLLGTLTASTLHTEFGWSTGLWWVWFLVGAVIVYLLNIFGIRIGARTGSILGLLEFAVFVILAVWLIVKAGHANTLSVFTMRYAHIKGYQGSAGLFAALVFVYLSFTGFEGAAPLAEETEHPRRAVRLALIFSVLAVGLFFILTTYASTVYFGPGRMAGFLSFGGGNPWTAIARQVWGIGWVLIFLALINSCIANTNAGALAGSRILYSMGRIRILPAAFSRVHPRWKSPYFALTFQMAAGAIIGISVGLAFGSSAIFGFLGTILSSIIVFMYFLACIGCIKFFATEKRSDWNPFLHLIIPVLGIALIIPAWLTAVGIRAFHFVSPLAYPYDLVGPIVGGWLLIGLIYFVYLLRKDPERLDAVGQVFLSEDDELSRTPSASRAD
jgi:amino acid transporter